ncbi:MAG: hypothetical protein EOP06_03845 [Proteobacteria bacterium]|nr:MAG: hypothetical protein EOP06_03845 [Pseudomonadota bacterium]
MKALLLTFAMTFSATSVFASDVCNVKQTNAASFQLAQQLGIPVQSVSVVKFDEGQWTMMMYENSGSDDITVSSSGNQITFRVSAKQIGDSEDCTVTGVTQVTSQYR